VRGCTTPSTASAQKLETFVHTLATHDGTVRRFTTSLDQVSNELAGERNDLSSALRNLSTALGQVTTFVKDNKQVLSTNITGLKNVLSVVVKQRDALNETLTDAPLALNNLMLSYDPEAGTLNANPNLTETGDQILNNPGSFLCGILGQATNGGSLCKLVETLLPRGRAFGEGTGSSYGVQSDPTLGGLVRPKAVSH
jgi:phospholipid/cholesterol/gamma-HCH transport system substrate-binding protein